MLKVVKTVSYNHDVTNKELYYDIPPLTTTTKTMNRLKMFVATATEAKIKMNLNRMSKQTN